MSTELEISIENRRSGVSEKTVIIFEPFLRGKGYLDLASMPLEQLLAATVPKSGTVTLM